MRFITATKEDKEIVSAINPFFQSYIEQSQNEYEFLFSLVRQNRPLKVLELGVSRGGSSVVLLSAIKDIENAHLYSIDYNEDHYKDKGKKTGFVVDSYPELKDKWTLLTGGVAGKFMDKVGGDIDIVFIDTVHSLPGEALDFLMVLPYLKENAIVIFHDMNYHTFDYNYSIVNNLLMSSIVGEKLLPEFAKEFYLSKSAPFPNIGAIKINNSTRDNIWNIFNILSIPWSYIPQERDILIMKETFAKHYDSLYCDLFDKIVFFVQEKENDKKLEEKVKKLNEHPYLTKATYLRYCILSVIMFGKKKKQYQQKKSEMLSLLKLM